MKKMRSKDRDFTAASAGASNSLDHDMIVTPLFHDRLHVMTSRLRRSWSQYHSFTRHHFGSIRAESNMINFMTTLIEERQKTSFNGDIV